MTDRPLKPLAGLSPRVRGKREAGRWIGGGGGGLSPRVRGKPLGGGLGGLLLWSIPACAGEALSLAASTLDWTVYPRVCGGSAAGLAAGGLRRGLSPRVRGKPLDGLAAFAPSGSIPACAGEAGVKRFYAILSKVYPRVCGGSSFAGLGRRCSSRSIPACAGEAAKVGECRSRQPVYPRVCGGSFRPDGGRV